jgi:hypothetical protein
MLFPSREVILVIFKDALKKMGLFYKVKKLYRYSMSYYLVIRSMFKSKKNELRPHIM